MADRHTEFYHHCNQTREACITEYAPLVRKLAYHLAARLPANVRVEDLIQIGMIGLLEAINRYEESLGTNFETYASQRIRGAMLDSLRETDWLPRSVRKELRRVEQAMQQLEQTLGRTPTEIEMAEALDMPLADYQQLLLNGRGHQLIYIEDLNDEEGTDFLDRYMQSDDEDPLTVLMDKNLRVALVQAISQLPEREKLVMGLYYQEELNLREIGEVLGVSESRVCQLHSQAIARLRAKLKQNY